MRKRNQKNSYSDLNFARLEDRKLLASIVVAPVAVSLTSVNGSYLQYGTDGSQWYDGSGLSDASIVESNDAVPAVWPEHISGNSADRVSRIRDATEINTLTFELGDRFDLTGMVLWNSTEAANDGTPRTNRGFENTRLSYSTDGGNTFSGNDLLTWTERSSEASPNQGANPPANAATFAPEVQMLPNLVAGVTHVRMEVDNFTAGGADKIVMASELRFIGDAPDFSTVASLSARTLEGTYNFTQGIEGDRDIELIVTLGQPNTTGAPITFDLDDLGTGNATPGLDYDAVPADAQIVVPAGSDTGTYTINVIDDLSIEATELIDLQISNPSDAAVTIGDASFTGTINDNDNAGVTIIGAGDLEISEGGTTDTYTIALDSVPTGVVQITATADSEIRISTDGVNFASTQVLSFTDTTPQTITVRAIDDQSQEDLHTATVTHAITGTVVDPNYPDVTVEDLYTQIGTDRPFQELIDSGDLPTGFNSTGGILGSTVDVNNAVLEAGLPSNASIPQDIRIHTVANSNIRRNFFNRWTRWYQEDGDTQVFRVFEGEENVRNSRALAARIEAFSPGWDKGVWNDFTARYTIVKPQSMSIFQSYQVGVEWSVHIGMTDTGDINFTHRRNYDGGATRFTLGTDMVGKSFEVRIRDNGHEYEVYFNGELKGQGYWERPNNDFAFRWGAYRGAREMTQDALVFVNGVEMQANTSAPTGLTPYRLATTSLSIDSVTATITDNDDGTQIAFVDQTIQDGTRILAEEFDLGGPGVAYNDTTEGNRGGAARPDEDVDLFAGSIVLSDIANGEWLEFTRDVTPGIYDLDVRTWSNNANNKSVRILIASSPTSDVFTELGTVEVPDTDNDRTTFTIPNVDLSDWGGSDRLIRVEFIGGRFSYDWIEFRAQETPATIVTRGISYGGATADYGEDAIDTSKTPYRFEAGTTSSFANYTSYSAGINRVIVDLANSRPASLTADDFVFRVGNTNTPADWTLLDGSSTIPLPTVVSGTRDENSGVQRFTLIWPDNAIQNQWLQVTVKAGQNTGLENDDVFYWGNAIAETGGDDTAVNSQDVLGVRANRTNPFAPAQIDNNFDINRSGTVDSTDVLIVRRNRTNPFNMLVELSAGSGGGGSSFSSGFALGDGSSDGNDSSAGNGSLVADGSSLLDDGGSVEEGVAIDEGVAIEEGVSADEADPQSDDGMGKGPIVALVDRDATEQPKKTLKFHSDCAVESPTYSKPVQEKTDLDAAGPSADFSATAILLSAMQLSSKNTTQVTDEPTFSSALNSSSTAQETVSLVRRSTDTDRQENQLPIAPLWMIDSLFEEKNIATAPFESDLEIERIFEEFERAGRDRFV